MSTLKPYPVAVQYGLCLTWSETQKTGFLTTRSILQMSMIEPALKDEKATRRRAGFVGMAVVVEGCADHITNK